MSAAGFNPVARTLESELNSWFAKRSRTSSRGERTVATNSTLLERRGRPLLAMLAASGIPSLPGRSVVDLGCGFGALSVFLAWHGSTVVGIDRDESLLSVGRRAAAEHGLPVELRESLMQDVDAPGNAFDVALMNNTLCYLVERSDREAALREARRLLRPGGILLIREPNGRFPMDPFTGIPLLSMLPSDKAARISKLLAKTRPPVALSSPKGLRNSLGSIGFLEVTARAGRPGTLAARAPSVGRYQHVTAKKPR